MVKRQVNLRRASSIAQLSYANKNPASAADFVKFSKTMIEFQILSLQSELNFLDELSTISDDEKTSILFEILEKDNDGTVTKELLITSLQGLKGEESFETRAAHASNAIEAAEMVDSKGAMTFPEFNTLIQALLPLLQCSMQELAEIILLKALFGKSSNTTSASTAVPAAGEETIPISPAFVKIEVAPTNKDRDSVKELRDAMRDERMKALFQIFDTNGAGVVDFQELVVGLYKAMESMDEANHAAVAALLLFDGTTKRELMYHDFARVMLNVVSSTSSRNFDDVADTLTRNAMSVSSGVTRSHVMEKFALDAESKLLLDISKHAKLEEFINLNVVELAKLDRLFKMFDIAGVGKISGPELALGLAKFHETTTMETTVQESMEVMKAFDRNEDGKLGHHEFTDFIVNFASSANMPLLEMLDFMITMMALKENTQAQEIYVKSIRAQDRLPLDIRYG